MHIKSSDHKEDPSRVFCRIVNRTGNNHIKWIMPVSKRQNDIFSLIFRSCFIQKHRVMTWKQNRNCPEEQRVLWGRTGGGIDTEEFTQYTLHTPTWVSLNSETVLKRECRPGEMPQCLLPSLIWVLSPGCTSRLSSICIRWHMPLHPE